jgi:DNA replication protein DnaC
LEEYDFNFPKRLPKAAIVRLFDCSFIERHGCVVLIGPTGTGKLHLLTAFGYTAAECGFSVRYTRVVDVINHLTTAQMNGLLGKALKSYVRPSLLLLDELGYLPTDKRAPICCSRYRIALLDEAALRGHSYLLDVLFSSATGIY